MFGHRSGKKEGTTRRGGADPSVTSKKNTRMHHPHWGFLAPANILSEHAPPSTTVRPLAGLEI